MATSGNTLFDQTYKKQLRERKNDWTFKVKIQVTKSAILLNFCKAARPQMFLILSIWCYTIQLIYYWGWQQGEVRIETYLKILKILEGQSMWLSWHYYQVIINKAQLDFEKTLLSMQRAFSVRKIKSIHITTNKYKLNIYKYLYTKYIKLYTTDTYELPEFLPRLDFQGIVFSNCQYQL